jgi:hypothetical protein
VRERKHAKLGVSLPEVVVLKTYRWEGLPTELAPEVLYRPKLIVLWHSGYSVTHPGHIVALVRLKRRAAP